MTNEEIEIELRHLSNKEDIANLRAEIHKELGEFKSDLMKMIWQTQLTTIGIILVGVGLLIHFRV
jgi:hypothetical protein